MPGESSSPINPPNTGLGLLGSKYIDEYPQSLQYLKQLKRLPIGRLNLPDTLFLEEQRSFDSETSQEAGGRTPA
jgi:hypothetical protein